VSPAATVLITTRNEEKNIGPCLASVRAQGLSPGELEILVVDNSSNDRTAEIARSGGARVLERGPERSAQRNLGLAEARGEFVLILDADMRLGAGVIAEGLSRFEHDGAAALYVPEKVVGSGWWARVRNFERGFYDGTVVDAVRFVRRAAALAAGGFDESLNGPEDWDFDRRMRAAGPVGITSAVLYHDEGNFGVRRYLAKKRYYARGFDAYIAKWGRGDPEIRRQFGPYYRYCGVFFENGKWRRLAAHPGLAAGMYCLRFAVGLSCLGRILRGGRGR